MSTLLSRARWLLEPVLAVVFFALWSLEVVGRHQLVPGALRATAPFWAALVLLSAAIGLARLRPLVAMAVGTAVLIGQLFFPTAVFDEPLLYLGFAVVTFVVAATVQGRMHVVALAFAVGVGVSIAGLLAWWSGIGRGEPGARALFFIMCTAAGLIAWLLGTLVGVWTRGRQRDVELTRATSALRAAQTEALVAGERERIAQDVHDIMAHSLSVILAQADGARLLAEERPAAVAPALTVIASTARSSLTEVRVLIETLVGAPQHISPPRPEEIDELLERLAASGLELTVERFGTPGPLTPSQQLAVYRIVQEGLTNALKHGGPGASARLALDQGEDGVVISISSRPKDGRPSPAAPNPSGRGLVGMRERARLAGGWLDAGEDDDNPGGFLVAAYIPAGGRPAEENAEEAA